MNLKKIAAIICGLLLTGVGCNPDVSTPNYYGTDKNSGTETGNICKTDTYTCPDGSTVSRLAPKCDFAPCPQNEVKSVGLTPETPAAKTINKKLSMQEKLTMQPPAPQIEQGKIYTAVLHTIAGDISIEMTGDQTPITVNNFVGLARANFYNDTIFHRIIRGFMIQGGDPRGDGTGGPAYRFVDEPFKGEYTRGTVAMANAGPNTNGSQFFIMHESQALPKNYTIFGHVVSGLDIVDRIAEAGVGPSDSGEMSKPDAPVTVKSVDILVK